MRKYYVHYYQDFGNAYNLYYLEDGYPEEMEGYTHAEWYPVKDGWKQITRKEAERLARAERQRRKTNAAFAGYACDSIYPADYPKYCDIRNDGRYELRGCIWEPCR